MPGSPSQQLLPCHHVLRPTLALGSLPNSPYYVPVPGEQPPLMPRSSPVQPSPPQTWVLPALPPHITICFFPAPLPS